MEGTSGEREEATGTAPRAVDHLFRHESGRMVAVLTRFLGPRNLALAEDVVQETLLEALRRWPFDGIPDNPGGWLYQVARRKAIDVIRHEQVLRRLAPTLAETQRREAEEVAIPLELPAFEGEIADDVLRMMFTCCHPALPVESQVALTLKVLGGFGTAEISRALLVSEEAVSRRLSRAKQRIREAGVPFEVPAGSELGSRLGAVVSVLYLMFNEGYQGSRDDHPIRRDVCREAMRLAALLAAHPATERPVVSALNALMCFHAARFDGRLDSEGRLLLLRDQDRSRWDRALIAEGMGWLGCSAAGGELSELHLEAGIAATHCQASSWEATDWRWILRLYDLLVSLNPSPVFALNRAIALAEVEGPRAGLAALDDLVRRGALAGYHLLHATVGEFHLRLGEAAAAEPHLRRARDLAPSLAERDLLEEKLVACGPPGLAGSHRSPPPGV